MEEQRYWACQLPVWAHEDEYGYVATHDCGIRCRSENEFGEHVYREHVTDWVEYQVEWHSP